MIKKTVFAVLTLLCALTLISCWPQNSQAVEVPWRQVVVDDPVALYSCNILDISYTNNALGCSDFWGPAISHLTNLDAPTSLELLVFSPAEEIKRPQIAGLCVADELWVVASDLGTVGDDWDQLKIFSYNFEAKSWSYHPELNHDKRSWCYTFPDKSLVFVSGNQLTIYKDSQWGTISLPEEDRIISVSQDNSYNLWLATAGGGLYRLQDQQQWTKIGAFNYPDHVSLQVSSPERVWFSTDTQVFLWNPDDATGQLKLVFEPETGDGPYKWTIMYEDALGVAWVVTQEGIWRSNGANFEEVLLPASEPSIFRQLYLTFTPNKKEEQPRIVDAAFDYIKNRLYVSIFLKGVFYFDTQDVSPQGGK